MQTETAFENILKKDRVIVLIGLFTILALSWIYTVYLASHMEMMDMKPTIIQIVEWDFSEIFTLFVMWIVMMIAMMIPSATPLILMFSQVNRKRSQRNAPYIPTINFILGYIFIWSGYSIGITLIQYFLHNKALLSPMMISQNNIFGGSILILAGIFQWTPLKNSCLIHCRSPLSFITTQWKEGKFGAFFMGIKHGNYCVGCCWILMALLFVSGVMNLLWISVITLYVLIEKIHPWGNFIGKITGVLLLTGGVIMIFLS
jgi:predicted metal-binding membrane protein